MNCQISYSVHSLEEIKPIQYSINSTLKHASLVLLFLFHFVVIFSNYGSADIGLNALSRLESQKELVCHNKGCDLFNQFLRKTIDAGGTHSKLANCEHNRGQTNEITPIMI